MSIFFVFFDATRQLLKGFFVSDRCETQNFWRGQFCIAIIAYLRAIFAQNVPKAP